MRYRNDKTGAVIDTPFEISGGDWRPVGKAPPKAETSADKEKKPKRRGRATAK